MKHETRSFYQAAVESAVERIFEHLDEALDLEALARLAALSPLHFHRIFRGLVGETPLELHRRLRLERAAYQLVSSDAAVTRVAFDAGYETHESFTRAFSAVYGGPPSSFRAASSSSETSTCARPPQWKLASRSSLHFHPVGRPAPPFLGTQGASAMQVEIKQLPGFRLATVRHVGPYLKISEAFGHLGSLVGPAGLFNPPVSQMIALFHDDPEVTPAHELQSDAGISVPEGVPLPPGTTELRIPAGRYASTTYVGPYTGLPDAWARFMGGWLPGSGHRMGRGASFEIYRNTPQDTPPEKLVTELYLPLS